MSSSYELRFATTVTIVRTSSFALCSARVATKVWRPVVTGEDQGKALYAVPDGGGTFRVGL